MTTETRDERKWQGALGSPIIVEDLKQLAENHRPAYLAAKPWPHVIIEDLIDPAAIATAENEESSRALRLQVRSLKRMVKAESAHVIGHAANDILDSLLTPEFVEFLEELTGVAGLVPDGTHRWAGIHVSPPGANQVIHRDFRLQPDTGMYHRVNVLIYLNSDWRKEYGGELEMWPKNMKACARQILPEGGRVVIFETTPTSYHGVPEPVQCPPGRARLSLVTCYYTAEPGPSDRREAIFFGPKRPQDPFRMRFRGAKKSAFTIWCIPRDFFRRIRTTRTGQARPTNSTH